MINRKQSKSYLVVLCILFGLFAFSSGCANVTSDDSTSAETATTVEITSLEINGDVATARVYLSADDDFESAVRKIAEAVYTIAKNNESINEVVISTFMSKDGLVDGYGNPIDKNLFMGKVTVKGEDVANARKYKNAEYYSSTSNPINTIELALIYVPQVKEFSRVDLLEGYENY